MKCEYRNPKFCLLLELKIKSDSPNSDPQLVYAKAYPKTYKKWLTEIEDYNKPGSGYEYVTSKLIGRIDKNQTIYNNETILDALDKDES